MPSSPDTNPPWGSSYRLTASEKWKAKSAAMGRPVTDALVECAHPRPGSKILDLASGTGEPAITLATRVGPTGHVTALDLSDELLAIAAQRARDRGLTNVSIQQADAQALPFPDNTFDLATSRFGVMFFADIDRAFSELLRVLRPGARACLLVWGPHHQPYFSTGFGTVHRHIGGPLLTPGGPDPFRFSTPDTLSDALTRNGFENVHEESRVLPWTWPGTVEEAWEQLQAIATPFLPLIKEGPARSLARDPRRRSRRDAPLRNPRRHPLRRQHHPGFRPKTVKSPHRPGSPPPAAPPRPHHSRPRRGRRRGPQHARIWRNGVETPPSVQPSPARLALFPTTDHAPRPSRPPRNPQN